MTIEEAKQTMYALACTHYDKEFYEKENEAIKIACKSLEAWESLREELKYELCKKVHEKDSCIPCPNQTTSCSYTGLRIYELNNIINHVIDKHLSEVENESTRS